MLIDIPKGTRVVDGKKYRMSLGINMAYTQANVNKIVTIILNADKAIHSMPSGIQAQYKYFKITNVSVEKGGPANGAGGALNKFTVHVDYVGVVPKSGKEQAALLSGKNSSNDVDFFPVLAIPEVVALGGVIIAIIAATTLGFVVISKSFKEDIAKPVTAPGGIIVVAIVAFILIKMGRH